MKVNISLDDELVERIDLHADSNYMTRSGLISLAVTQYLNANDVVLAIKDISLAMRKIADLGAVDEPTLQQLADFERFVGMITGQKK